MGGVNAADQRRLVVSTSPRRSMRVAEMIFANARHDLVQGSSTPNYRRPAAVKVLCIRIDRTMAVYEAGA